jgi:uncharacterized protein YjbI with pentapeptide repeats
MSEQGRRGAGLLTAGSAAVLLWSSVAFGWSDWPTVGRWFQDRAAEVVLLGVAVLLVGAGVQTLLVKRRRTVRAPALSWWVVAAAACVVGVVAWGATSWLLVAASSANDPSAARVEAIKTGLGIAAGTGGIFALLLAVRRQWHQELTATDTAFDAGERRVTELYTKAVEQLGSGHAAVRLGGLYALERVAQNTPEQRQTIVNVLCAYLRMPYRHVGETLDAGNDREGWAERRELIQEGEVRLTAQRILADHLNPLRAGAFWGESVSLDLAGATLIDFDLQHCHVHDARFTGAAFHGHAQFGNTTFHGAAMFAKATFQEAAWFDNGTVFRGQAQFSDALFRGAALFANATFEETTLFTRAVFEDGALFGRACFAGITVFEGAAFRGVVWFDKVGFAGIAFVKAIFGATARFPGTKFQGVALFDEADFEQDALFEDAVFTDRTSFENVKFKGAASFAGATREDVPFQPGGFRPGNGTTTEGPVSAYPEPSAREGRDLEGGDGG